MIRSNEAGSWGGCGAGDVSRVSVWETGLERLRDDGLDGRDDPGSELELSVPSGEPPGVNMAGMSSLAGLGLYPMNYTVIGVVGLCCRGGKLVWVSAGGSLVVSGHWWLGSVVRCWCWHWVQSLGNRKDSIEERQGWKSHSVTTWTSRWERKTKKEWNEKNDCGCGTMTESFCLTCMYVHVSI